jgi:hypothetical protein
MSKIPFSPELAEIYQDRGYIGPYSVLKWKADGIPAYLADPDKVISLKDYVTSSRRIAVRRTNSEYLAHKAAKLVRLTQPDLAEGHTFDKATSSMLARFYQYAAKSPIRKDADPLLARARIQMWFRNRRIEILQDSENHK